MTRPRLQKQGHRRWRRDGASCETLSHKLVAADIFGQQIQLVIPGDRDRYKSLLGTVMTLAVIVSIIIQAIYLASNKELRETEITQFTQYGANHYLMNFTIEDGFDVAFAPVRFNSSHNETLDDPSYGRFFFEINEWADNNQNKTKI